VAHRAVLDCRGNGLRGKTSLADINKLGGQPGRERYLDRGAASRVTTVAPDWVSLVARVTVRCAGWPGSGTTASNAWTTVTAWTAIRAGWSAAWEVVGTRAVEAARCCEKRGRRLGRS
jgi:hypothetical protein